VDWPKPPKRKPRPPLLEAVMRGRSAEVRKLLRAGADANQRDRFGAAMHDAAERGALNLIRLLQKHGAKIDERDAQGMTPLFLASRRGKPEVVRHLLAHGANVDGKNPDFNPLGTAIVRGWPKVVQALLAAGANVKRRSKFDGFTMLMDAAFTGRRPLVRMILPYDRDRSSRQEALLLAAKEGHTGIVRLLLADGVDPNRCKFRRKSALAWARRNRHGKIVKLLLAANAT
jgi:ankyrin repeat protein